jgi:phosphopantetheinyl transferase
MCFALLNPSVFVLSKWRGESHERDGRQPSCLDKGPDQEAVEIVILPTGLPLLFRKTDHSGVAVSITIHTNNIICFQTSQSPIQVGIETLTREDKLATE